MRDNSGLVMLVGLIVFAIGVVLGREEMDSQKPWWVIGLGVALVIGSGLMGGWS